MDGVARVVYARADEDGVNLVGMNGRRWELCQVLSAGNTALTADSEDKLQKLVEEFGRVWERRK